MTRFFWDTNLFIYRWDTASPLFQPVKTLHSRMIASGIELVISTLALGELQVGPRKTGDLSLALRYKTALAQMATVVSFDQDAADNYAMFVKTPDQKGLTPFIWLALLLMAWICLSPMTTGFREFAFRVFSS